MDSPGGKTGKNVYESIMISFKNVDYSFNKSLNVMLWWKEKLRSKVNNWRIKGRETHKNMYMCVRQEVTSHFTTSGFVVFADAVVDAVAASSFVCFFCFVFCFADASLDATSEPLITADHRCPVKTRLDWLTLAAVSFHAGLASPRQTQSLHVCFGSVKFQENNRRCFSRIVLHEAQAEG